MLNDVYKYRHVLCVGYNYVLGWHCVAASVENMYRLFSNEIAVNFQSPFDHTCPGRKVLLDI